MGPGDDLDWRLGLVSEIIEGAHQFEPGHDAVGAVDLAAGRLRVGMAAGHHRRQARVPAGPAREDIADLVDADGAAGLLAPADEKPARLAVEIARRKPAHPALRGRPDLRQFHQARPQPLAVDLQVPNTCRHRHHLFRYQSTPTHFTNAVLPVSTVSGSTHPIRCPIPERGTVAALSTITCDRFCNPVSRFASTVIRNNGQSCSSLVTRSTVTDVSPSKASAWTTRAGRGLP